MPKSDVFIFYIFIDLTTILQDFKAFLSIDSIYFWNELF